MATGEPNYHEVMPVNLTVAFIGDVSLDSGGQSLYKLIKESGAEAAIIAGDLDYTGDVDLWDKTIDDYLGPNFPVFAL